MKRSQSQAEGINSAVVLFLRLFQNFPVGICSSASMFTCIWGTVSFWRERVGSAQWERFCCLVLDTDDTSYSCAYSQRTKSMGRGTEILLNFPHNERFGHWIRRHHTGIVTGDTGFTLVLFTVIGKLFIMLPSLFIFITLFEVPSSGVKWMSWLSLL